MLTAARTEARQFWVQFFCKAQPRAILARKVQEVIMSPKTLERDLDQQDGSTALRAKAAATPKSTVVFATGKSDLALRRRTHFVLWRPRSTAAAPKLIIGQFQPGNPPTLSNERSIALALLEGFDDLWGIPAAQCKLTSGTVYHYWFEVTDSNPYRDDSRIRITDPAAATVDWRLLAPQLPSPYDNNDSDPAAVVKFENNELIASDQSGRPLDWSRDPGTAALAANNHLVIYELPTAWARIGSDSGGSQIGVGTFRDVQALVEHDKTGANFKGTAALAAGRSHLQELGVNALELLPPADSFVDREWGYATSNYFAPDFDLGFPKGHSEPTANQDLIDLVSACHGKKIRFFCDMVTAFATHAVYENLNYLDFHVQPNTGDPEQGHRNGWGGQLFKYNYFTTSYDPISGKRVSICPGRQLMKAYLERWMDELRCDGLRLDSIENIGNWDFVQEFKDLARQYWRARWQSDHGTTGGTTGDADERFLVVGEELSVPTALVTQNRLDGLWNETFLYRIRAALLGETHPDYHEDFETAIRNLIDCRRLGFGDLSQAINYVTSHDVEGWRKERLANFCANNGIWDAAKRIKLAFACLMTAVGVPQIFAGEEFADVHDRPPSGSGKQEDPVNFDRLSDPWRKDVFDYVSRLAALRTSAGALATNDVQFLHFDFAGGKRVAAWLRGRWGSDDAIVTVANFSDWSTDTSAPNAEYVVPNWPSTPPGKKWFEVTQKREVPASWIGREPLYPWEAKVYRLI
jgi:pullulanase